MSNLLILFGPPGVGKNFVGEILQQDFWFRFYDADADLTAEQVDAIHQQRLFTEEMRQRYFSIVCERIRELQLLHPNLVVAQALAKEINRHQLLSSFPNAKLILIQAESLIIDTRIQLRKDWVSVEYAQKIRDMFEVVQVKHCTLDNNQDKMHIHQQLQLLV